VKISPVFFLLIYFIGQKNRIAYIGYLKNILVLLELFSGSDSSYIRFQPNFKSLVMYEVIMYLFCPHIEFVCNFYSGKIQWAPFLQDAEINLLALIIYAFFLSNLRSCRKCYSLSVKFLMSLSHIFMTLFLSLLK